MMVFRCEGTFADPVPDTLIDEGNLLQESTKGKIGLVQMVSKAHPAMI
jgi:hypothetical protein